MTTLAELNRVMAQCLRCPELAKGRTQVVPGDGPETARALFIGEAPGFYEDQQGSPFVGAAGQFLNSLLSSIGWRREEVFITNIIKCRPPGNRDPLPQEMANCAPWLDQQLEIVCPQVVVTLGRYSLARFFPGQSISKAHGTMRQGDGSTYYAMYHPAAALHQQSLRRTLEEDMKKLPQLLARVGKERVEGPRSEQLGLF